MTENILQNLAQKYFQGIAEDISNAKVISSIFPNMSDVGDTRENILLKFLQSHLPSRCSVVKGGFVFDSENHLSNQMDLLIVNDFSLKFSYFDQHSHNSKNIQTVEGCLASISVKSTLDKEKLYDALENLSSIPKMPADMLEKINPALGASREIYLSLPRKIVFAFSGLSVLKIIEHINSFYSENSILSEYQKADLIIVNNSYCIQRAYKGGGKTRDGSVIPEGTFHPMYSNDNIQNFGALPLFWLLMKIQETTQLCPHVLFNYQKYFDNMDFHKL